MIYSLRLKQLICLLYNPVVVIYLLVLGITWSQFPELSFLAITHRALTASMEAITFSIVDSIVSRTSKYSSKAFAHSKFSYLQIYGNWLYPLIATIFLPIWITFFGVLCIRSSKNSLKSGIKFKTP